MPGAELVTARQGLSAARVRAELERQGWRCALCLRDLGEHYAVDHDHTLAATHGHPVERGCERCFRAVVCNRCNSVLGWGWDDPDYFERVAAYIRLARSGELRAPRPAAVVGDTCACCGPHPGHHAGCPLAGDFPLPEDYHARA